MKFQRDLRRMSEEVKKKKLAPCSTAPTVEYYFPGCGAAAKPPELRAVANF
jgi:hypothetical protein